MLFVVRIWIPGSIVTAGRKVISMEIDISKARVVNGKTEFIASADGTELWKLLQRKCSRRAELTVFDGRRISIDQRKKIYATLNDLAAWTGYLPEECKARMKYYYIERTGGELFSLSTCEMDTARSFLNVLLDFCLENGVPLRDTGLDRTDDIYHYLCSCIRNRKCCICGAPADIHHVDAIGMGRDRRHYDDSGNEVIALCRKHHGIAHQKGNLEFFRMYHVYGIRRADVREEDTDETRGYTLLPDIRAGRLEEDACGVCEVGSSQDL